MSRNIENRVHEGAIVAGSSVSLEEENRCVTCGLSGSRSMKLKTCSRCQGVQYCSRTCQANDFRFHKVPCKNVDKYSSCRPSWENLVFLGDAFMDIGHRSKLLSAYFKALACYKQALVITIDDPAVHAKVISALLAVKWDDNAFSFMRMWSRPPDDKISTKVSRTDRFADFYDLITFDRETIPPYNLIALSVIKLHILEATDRHECELEAFARAIANYPCLKSKKNLDIVVREVRKCLIGGRGHEQMIARQEKLLYKYLDILDSKNPFYLSAICSPESLRFHDEPKKIVPKLMAIDPRLEEVYLFLYGFYFLFERLPSAKRRVWSRVMGKNDDLFHQLLKKLK